MGPLLLDFQNKIELTDGDMLFRVPGLFVFIVLLANILALIGVVIYTRLIQQDAKAAIARSNTAVETLRTLNASAQQAQRAIESEHFFHLRYAALADAADRAYVVFDSEGVILEWNASAEAHFGWRKSEAIGRNVVMLCPDNPKTLDECAIADIIATTIVGYHKFQLRFCDRGGQCFPTTVVAWATQLNKAEMIYGMLVRRNPDVR